MGLLWWADYDWLQMVQSKSGREGLRKLGFDAADKLERLDGRVFPSQEAYFDAIRTRLNEKELLVVYPSVRLVAVRMHEPEGGDSQLDADDRKYGFTRFYDAVRATIPRK